MEPNAITSRPHFHIQWDGFDRLDWQCFDTRAKAMTLAKELARLDEVFTIVEVCEECPVREQTTSYVVLA